MDVKVAAVTVSVTRDETTLLSVAVMPAVPVVAEVANPFVGEALLMVATARLSRPRSPVK